MRLINTSAPLDTLSLRTPPTPSHAVTGVTYSGLLESVVKYVYEHLIAIMISVSRDNITLMNTHRVYYAFLVAASLLIYYPHKKKKRSVIAQIGSFLPPALMSLNTVLVFYFFHTRIKISYTIITCSGIPWSSRCFLFFI